jgi:hypothetical protein
MSAYPVQSRSLFLPPLDEVAKGDLQVIRDKQETCCPGDEMYFLSLVL